ncbi:unnamed protein product, partial [Scytosiphon promiscuus]
GASTSPGGSGSDQHDDHQRDLPAGSKLPQLQGRSRRAGSFLDAVGGAISRGSRGKKDERSEAVALAEQLSAQRAERISCIAFKLVREIQRILKEAREKQAAAAATAAAAAAASAALSSTSSSSPHGDAARSAGTPAPTPPPPEFRKGAGSPTPTGAAAAATAAAAAAKKKNRWAGTDELLSLLDGGSPGGAGEVEDKVERYGSIAEVQAKMSDLVEQALVPESHGDLCGQLLEAAAGEGQHPTFVKLCVDAGLPSNLVHCLRIMRVVEFESARHDIAGVGGTAAPSSFGASASSDDQEEDGAVRAGEETEPSRLSPDDERPRTERATERIGRLLVTLCGDRSAGVGEQIKPHLPGLLSLAVSAYPRNGAHVQETARAVVEALMDGCLNSSMVWLLHYNKAMLDVVGELRHLSGLDGTALKSPTSSRKGGRGGYTPRSVSPVAKGSHKRSPKSGKGGGSRSSIGSVDNSAGDGSEPSSMELVGAAAEARGLWLAALRAAVSTVRSASRFVPAFVQDFEAAGGYETVGYMVRRSSIDRLPAMLEQVCLLVSATSTGGMERMELPSGRMERSDLMASNSAAFGIIHSLLAECTPPVEAVCLQGVAGRVSSGTCDISCLSGGHGLAEQGLDPEDAVVMVAERAVAMRLDRWGREHGVFSWESGPDSAPPILSITSSSGTEDDDEEEEDDDDEVSSGIGSAPSEGEGDSGGEGAAAAGRRRGRRRRNNRGFARVSVGAGEMAADVAETDEFRLRLLEAVLGLYSNHPLNYHELETKFHALSFFLCALPYYENRELKGLALKTLEVICVSFKDVHPRDALHSTSTAFTVCLDHMMGLLTDPLSSGEGRVIPLYGDAFSTSGGGGSASDGPEATGAGQPAPERVSFGRSHVGSGGGGDVDGRGEDAAEGGQQEAEEEQEDPKITAALEKALLLLEDADMMRRMLEKLLEFDEKKFTAMFQATGILDQVLQPLLKRVLTLNVGASPGAAVLWRAMRHPEGIIGGSTTGLAAAGGGTGGVGGGGGGGVCGEIGSMAPVEETGALALVSRATGLLCGTLALLLGSSQAVCRQFRALRMHDTLYHVIRDFGPPSTEAALSALERASSSEPSGVPEDMAFLIELVQGSKSRAERWRQAAALMGLRSILLCKHQAVKDVWRESCGFEASLAAISSLDAAFSPTTPRAATQTPIPAETQATSSSFPHPTAGESPKTGAAAARRSLEEAFLCEAEYFRVIQAALFTLVASASAGPAAVVRGERLVGCRANRRYLRREISYDSLACCLVNSGVVASPTYAGPALRLLFTMVTELPCDSMRFEAAAGGTESAEGEDLAWAALGALNQVVRSGGFAEVEALVAAGVVRRAAEVLAKALHAQTALETKNRAEHSVGSAVSNAGPDGTVDVAGSKAVIRAAVGSGAGVGSAALVRAGGASRRPSDEAASRGRERGLWEPLRLTRRLRQRLVEFIVLVASRHMTLADLPPVMRAITLPIVVDSRGNVAPPTAWPLRFALPPPDHHHAGHRGGKAFWLPGWGTFVPPSFGDGGAVVRTADDGAAAAAAAATPWPWLGVLSAMSARAEESTPFLRLGGSACTDMSSLCHEISRAAWRDADGSGKLWRGQQKALVEAALEEGVRMVHVPGLEGSASASFGDGGGGGAAPDGASWPGPAGYSFACWMRPWNDAVAAVAGAGAGSAPAGDTLSRKKSMEDGDVDLEPASSSRAIGRRCARFFPTRRSLRRHFLSRGFTMDVAQRRFTPFQNVGSVGHAPKSQRLAAPEPRRSLTCLRHRAARYCTRGKETGHDDAHTQEIVLWIFAVASPDGRAFFQLFLDLDLLLFCARGSSFREEIRFNTPEHLACGGARVWHHVLLAHSRAKSRILGTRDKLCLWVDGELADTVKVDSTSFTTSEGSPCAYLGCPHPQAFLESSVGATVAPVWHLGPCVLVTEALELAPMMFALGPEYTGIWTAESPLEAISSANAAGALRRLQALGGAAGFGAIGGDVPHALQRRGLRDLDRCFNVSERVYYWNRSDRAGVTDSFYLLLAPELVTFAFNTRHMERPGGPTPPDAAGGGGGVHASSLADDP